MAHFIPRLRRPLRQRSGPCRWLAAGFAALGAAAPPTQAATGAPAAIQACSLLTQKEVSSIVQRPVEAGKFVDNGITRDGAHSTTCLWTAPLAPKAAADPQRRFGGRGFVVLNIISWPRPSDARKFLDSFDEAFKKKEITTKPVSVRVGADDALWWGDGVAGRKNGASFGISVAQMGDKESRRPEAERLAILLVKRLPDRGPSSP